MTKCTDHNFLCQNPDYSAFDKTAKKELKNPTTASDVVNGSRYCMLVPTDEFLQIGDLRTSKFLKPIERKIGIYHLWREYDNCDDHHTYTMQCEYVGKGYPNTRVREHIKNKWQKEESLYVTFHECENRLAKYYEQLFLDKYQFNLNVNENHGTQNLYAVWDEERFSCGTHLNEISNYSKMNSPDDW